MFSKIGSFAVRYKFWIISAWVIAAALMYFLAPSLSEVGTMKESAFLPEDSESLRARELIEQCAPCWCRQSPACWGTGTGGLASTVNGENLVAEHIAPAE